MIHFGQIASTSVEQYIVHFRCRACLHIGQFTHFTLLMRLEHAVQEVDLLFVSGWVILDIGK